jgi:bifunctional DNase/RNase
VEKKKLNIVGLYKPIPDRNSSVLIFKEENGDRKLFLKIGWFETDAILMTLEGIKPKRPLIYDLFRKVCSLGYVEMQEVLIYKLEKDIYYSRIVFSNEVEEIELTVHTCDAIALALRFNAPIYTYESVLKKAIRKHHVPDEIQRNEKNSKVAESANEFKNASLNKLKELLKNAVDNEDYEIASLLRDELLKRNNAKK